MSASSSTDVKLNGGAELFLKKMKSQDAVNILMVDDQPGKLLSYEAILSDLGENLVKATSAKEALEKLLKTECNSGVDGSGCAEARGRGAI